MKHNPLKSTSAGICQVIIGLVHLPGSTLLLFNITGFCDSVCRPICLNCKFFHICSCLFLSFKILLSFSSRPAVTLHPILLFWSPSSLSLRFFFFFFLSLCYSTIRSNFILCLQSSTKVLCTFPQNVFIIKLSPETLTVWDST